MLAQTVGFPMRHPPHKEHSRASSANDSSVRSCKAFGAPAAVKMLIGNNWSNDAAKAVRAAPIPFKRHHSVPRRDLFSRRNANMIIAPCSGIGSKLIEPSALQSVFYFWTLQRRKHFGSDKAVPTELLNLHGFYDSRRSTNLLSVRQRLNSKQVRHGSA